MQASQSISIGAIGERLAADRYKARGYTVLKTNFRTRFGEIDIILKKADVIVFCEVKTRSGKAIARPGEWVNEKKQKKLIKTAQEYLYWQKLGEVPMRFDVAEVVLDKQSPPVVNIIKNAFEVKE